MELEVGRVLRPEPRDKPSKNGEDRTIRYRGPDAAQRNRQNDHSHERERRLRLGIPGEVVAEVREDARPGELLAEAPAARHRRRRPVQLVVEAGDGDNAGENAGPKQAGVRKATVRRLSISVRSSPDEEPRA